ncbi:glycosyl hydrolase family 30 TIM-barrel domain-containing protein [Ditylenchus destructor]|uniref:Glucosylceramidase n=1 Tax=Ditylenchus destructor TaxID=166010 RepID=A0AAD4MPP2_9BILA|nr:glycosyl hydrolase family 30 TIM-barrel domain-containing protein [Ditylenchus destructor]
MFRKRSLALCRHLKYFLFVAVSQISLTGAVESGCIEKSYSSATDIVCVCNSTYCDTIPPLGQLGANQTAIYVSSKSGKRFEKTVVSFGSHSAPSLFNLKDVEVVVDPSESFQTILGFGGAFTDSVGINLNRLSSAARQNLLQSYFGQSGLGYTVGRVPMASCDFSTHAYSYCDTSGDFNLTTFNLTVEDFVLKVPYIKQARNLAGVLDLFASPWSAPGWMKSSGEMVGGGTLKGDFNGEYYRTWANYFVRFFEEYHKEGIDFWGVTLQNEPSAGAIPNYSWQAMYFSAAMQRDFAAYLLGPTLKNSTVTSGLKLMVVDDQRYTLPLQPDIIFASDVASNYIDGVAVHWYWDYLFPASLLGATHDHHPDKFILATEACNGYLAPNTGPIMGDWGRGELYGKDIIEDLQNWAIGWVD